MKTARFINKDAADGTYPMQVMQHRNENIEILRAVAIIYVLVLHLGFLLVFPSANYAWLISHFEFSVGVDLFFVISGFVITRSLSDSFSSGNAKRPAIVVSFWIKRIYRLLPAALFWLAVALLFYLVTGELWDGAGIDVKKLVPMAAACANVFNLYNAGCAAGFADPWWCDMGCFFFYGHYWSLSLEEQFYLVFPFIFIFLRRRLLIGLLLLIIVFQSFWLRPHWSFGWFFRIDGFCWGILLALVPWDTKHWENSEGLPGKRVMGFIVSFGLILLLPVLSSLMVGLGKPPKTYGISVVSLIAAIMVLLAIQKGRHFGSWPTYRKWMLYIGSRSYSLYLAHLIVFYIVKRLWNVSFGGIHFSDIGKSIANITIVIAALGISAVMAEITYRLIELKFRLKGRLLAGIYLKRRCIGAIHGQYAA